MMTINHGGGGSPTISIGKESTIKVSLYGLIATLAQMVIVTAMGVGYYMTITAKQATFDTELVGMKSKIVADINAMKSVVDADMNFMRSRTESDLNYLRANQTSYNSAYEKVLDRLREVDVLKRDIQTARERGEYHERWINEMNVEIKRLSNQAAEMNILIKTLHPEVPGRRRE